METQIRQQLIDLLARDYGPVDEQVTIAEQYDLDSLSIVELYLLIEDEFNIDVPDELRKMKITVNDLVKLVQDLKAK